jgi:hypothetical protein
MGHLKFQKSGGPVWAIAAQKKNLCSNRSINGAVIY